MVIMMIDKLIFNLFLFRVFSRDVVLGGGNCFCADRKCKEYAKKKFKKNLFLFGGGNSKLRAEIPPPPQRP